MVCGKTVLNGGQTIFHRGALLCVKMMVMERRQIRTLTVLRQRAGLTQMDLALAVGCSQTHISHWEKDMGIPPVKAEAILAVLRSHSRDSVLAGIRPIDLSRAWDDVLLERAAVARS